MVKFVSMASHKQCPRSLQNLVHMLLDIQCYRGWKLRPRHLPSHSRKHLQELRSYSIAIKLWSRTIRMMVFVQALRFDRERKRTEKEEIRSRYCHELRWSHCWTKLQESPCSLMVFSPVCCRLFPPDTGLAIGKFLALMGHRCNWI